MRMAELTPWAARNKYWVDVWRPAEAWLRCLVCGEVRHLTGDQVRGQAIDWPCRAKARHHAAIRAYCDDPSHEMRLLDLPEDGSPAWLECGICGHRHYVPQSGPRPSRLRCQVCKHRKGTA